VNSDYTFLIFKFYLEIYWFLCCWNNPCSTGYSNNYTGLWTYRWW